MRYKKTSRRFFLTGAAGATLALPLLPSLLPRSLRRIAEAAAPEIPRRFVAIKSYSGAPVLDFYPTRAPSGYGTHRADGTVALNDDVPSNTIAPFGGFKMSGLGRECSTEGIEAFLETKHVSIGI